MAALPLVDCSGWCVSPGLLQWPEATFFGTIAVCITVLLIVIWSRRY